MKSFDIGATVKTEVRSVSTFQIFLWDFTPPFILNSCLPHFFHF